jgi:Tol biopolymer transport system component
VSENSSEIHAASPSGIHGTESRGTVYFGMTLSRAAARVALTICLIGCGQRAPATPSASAEPTASPTPLPSRTINTGNAPVATGEPIDIGDLSGRIVFDDFEDVFAMDVDGSNVVTIAGDPAGPEFDGAWSPDGQSIVYRDSTRGTNKNDEIFVARADGSEHHNITNDPANDWGPDWSPDGRTIAFNSDRAGGPPHGYLMDPDGRNVRAIGVDRWVEYPSFSPDGTKIAYMGATGSNYEIWVADLASGAVEQLTDSPGHDSWPAWSPDGSTIAFSSVRDDCGFAPSDQECWRSGDIGDYFDIWLMNADGSNERRVSAEFGQFVAWSPDGRYLLISGYGLYVVRPDGTGRLELRADGMARALGGIPDWR